MKKGKWMICVNPYEIDGKQFYIGEMVYDTSRGIINNDWRLATQYEIDNKQYYKAKFYYKD